VPAITEVSSKVSLSGHTDQAPYVSDDESYTNWELSVDRANAARRALVSAGLPEDKIGRVVGLGSSVPFVKDDPFNPINRRISMIVLNKKAEEALSQEAGPAIDAPEAPVHRADVTSAPVPGSGSDARTRPVASATR
jgi:chemotaxis protein MotB